MKSDNKKHECIYCYSSCHIHASRAGTCSSDTESDYINLHPQYNLHLCHTIPALLANIARYY